jgi:hypothetical protein
VRDDDLLSPDLLLRRAAQGDAARAAELLAYVTATKLLDAVLTQAELAVDEDRDRPAGIDAIAELDRAAIEVMDLPQGADLELDAPSITDEVLDGDADALRLVESPVLIGWELVTVQPEELATSTVALPVRPWQLMLVAFSDHRSPDGTVSRSVVAAAADGRLIAATLRFHGDDDPDVLGATVSRDPADLGGDTQLALGLRAALDAAAQGA